MLRWGWGWALAWHLLTVERTSSVNHKIEKRCSQRGAQASTHTHTHTLGLVCASMCAYVHVEPWQLWLCCEVSFGFKPHKSHLSAVVNMSYSHTHTHAGVCWHLGCKQCSLELLLPPSLPPWLRPRQPPLGNRSIRGHMFICFSFGSGDRCTSSAWYSYSSRLSHTHTHTPDFLHLFPFTITTSAGAFIIKMLTLTPRETFANKMKC